MIEIERFANPRQGVPNGLLALIGGQVDEPHRQLGHQPLELELLPLDRPIVGLFDPAPTGWLDEHSQR